MELHLRAVSARNLLDKQTFGRQDPFCEIHVGHKTFKTRVHDNGHKTPYWNEVFVFDVLDPQLDQVHIQVKDKNFTLSVLIGETRLPVNMFLHGNLVDQWFPLNNRNRYAGEINLRIQLCGVNASKTPALAGTYTMPAPAPTAYPMTQPMYQPPPQQQGYATAVPMYAAAPQPQPVMAPAPMMMQQQPTPVMMTSAPPNVMYSNNAPYDPYGHHGYHHGHRRRGSGDMGDMGDMGDVAMGAGAGLVGGFILGELLG